MPNKVCGDPMLGKVKQVADWGDLGAWITPVVLRSDLVCVSGVHERADRRNQSEDERTNRAAEN